MAPWLETPDQHTLCLILVTMMEDKRYLRICYFAVNQRTSCNCVVLPKENGAWYSPMQFFAGQDWRLHLAVPGVVPCTSIQHRPKV